MKRLTALILSIVYLSFAFGSQNYDNAVTGSFYTSATDSEEQIKKLDVSSEKETVSTSFSFKKIHKHLAGIAKVKLPRPSVTAANNNASLFPAYLNNSCTHLIRTGTPLWPSTTLYLRNCVFLI